MPKFSYKSQRKIRRFHRYIAVFVGIQLLFWTVSGLYFSWNNMDDVHGDTFRIFPKNFVGNPNFALMDSLFDEVEKTIKIDSIKSIGIVKNDVLPMARFSFFYAGKLHHQLIDLEKKSLRPPLSEVESVKLAQESFRGKVGIKNVKLLSEKDVHQTHEYRGSVLPAFAIEFDHASGLTAYVAPELGEVTSFRNNNWRRFDFLWMMHTMDYQTRDVITNWVLRIFSVLGLLTVFSGFLLYFATSKKIIKK
ncbi:MAG: hypothetical protein RQ735_03295 [Flavobacteriaceae bacterium]|nr:hypothetical protein [Flavobacteriaceae bacterium]